MDDEGGLPAVGGIPQKRNRRQKRDEKAKRAKHVRAAALEDEGNRREKIRVKVTEAGLMWSFPLQPHPRTGYGGQGLARASVWLAIGADKPEFMTEWTTVFNEHVNWGKRGNAFTKAVKRERDANMLWRQRLREKMATDSATITDEATTALADSVGLEASAPKAKGKEKDRQSQARLTANEARSLVKRSKAKVNVTAQQHAIDAYRRAKLAAKHRQGIEGSSVSAVPSKAKKGHRDMSRFD